MRLLLLLFFLSASILSFATKNDISSNGIDSTYQIIGDSVFFENGETCHIDNFENGTCNDSSWNFNFFNFWIGLLIPFVLFGYIAITVKRKINKRKVE